jgi:iron complex outermembrane receptor protein
VTLGSRVTAAGPGLRLSGHFSWLDAAYDRFLAVLPDGATRPVEGNRLNNAPEWSGAGSAVYEYAARRGTASLRGDLSWQSQVFFTPVNDAIETHRAYGLLHLRAAFEPTSNRWEMAFYVRIARNREYIVGTGNAALPAFTARPGEPRLWARNSRCAGDAGFRSYRHSALSGNLETG